MPVSNGIFSKPIRLKEDLANFFGLTANLGYIIKNASINKWSKRKPVKSSKVTELEESDFSAANYGIGNTAYWTLLASMKTGYTTGSPIPDNMTALPTEYWSYEKPTGDTYRYRMLDFNGYRHTAEAPISKITDTELVYKGDNVITITFPMGAMDSYTVKLADLGIVNSAGEVTHSFSSMYFGVCIYNSTKTYFVTQSTTISQLAEYGNSLRLTSGATLAGTWSIFAFISDRAITTLQTADAVVGKYLPIPETLSTVTISAYVYSFTITVSYAYRQDTRTIAYMYTITNGEDSQFTTDSILIELLDSSNNVLASTTNVAVSVEANSSYTKTATIVTTAAYVSSATALRVSTTLANQELIGMCYVTDELPKDV